MSLWSPGKGPPMHFLSSISSANSSLKIFCTTIGDSPGNRWRRRLSVHLALLAMTFRKDGSTAITRSSLISSLVRARAARPRMRRFRSRYTLAREVMGPLRYRRQHTACINSISFTRSCVRSKTCVRSMTSMVHTPVGDRGCGCVWCFVAPTLRSHASCLTSRGVFKKMKKGISGNGFQFDFFQSIAFRKYHYFAESTSTLSSFVKMKMQFSEMLSQV